MACHVFWLEGQDGLNADVKKRWVWVGFKIKVVKQGIELAVSAVFLLEMSVNFKMDFQ